MKLEFLLTLALLFGPGTWAASAQERAYHRLVVFSDLHLPGRLIPEKNKAVDTVNGWEDVDGVAVTGDIAAGRGTPEEFAFAKDFLARLKKPVFPITGNHDFMYDAGPDGKTRKAPSGVRAAKLRAFQETFGLPALRYTRKFGRYLCLFVSADDLQSPFLAAASSGTLAWMEDELAREPDAPAIVFFHAPLEGTIRSRNEVTGIPSFEAQPAKELRALLRRHPQVFLWVSGHTHIGATNPRFADAKINLYDGRVHEMHNCDMDGRSYLSAEDRTIRRHDTIWTNSLFLYPDKAVVKTYDHKKGRWVEKLSREFRP
jgi:3',5'-cyclic AMP phosphodiesterase CpdA